MPSNPTEQATREPSSIVGDWLIYYPHALGVILGTGFKEFISLAGIVGLAKEHDSTLEILAVNATVPGIGQFRRFIEFLRTSGFKEIYIWEVWNPDLAKALRRYGFKRVVREEKHETLTGFKWTRGVRPINPTIAEEAPRVSNKKK